MLRRTSFVTTACTAESRSDLELSNADLGVDVQRRAFEVEQCMFEFGRRQQKWARAQLKGRYRHTVSLGARVVKCKIWQNPICSTLPIDVMS